MWQHQVGLTVFLELQSYCPQSITVLCIANNSWQDSGSVTSSRIENDSSSTSHYIEAFRKSDKRIRHGMVLMVYWAHYNKRGISLNIRICQEMVNPDLRPEQMLDIAKH